MGKISFEAADDFAAGVITAAEVDAIPPNASPYGINSALVSSAGNRASVMKRKGMRCMNATPITGSPVVLGQLAYNLSGTLYHLLISNNGRLDRRNNSTGATAAADATAAAPFTSGDHYPDSAIAQSLAFFCNGQDKKKFNGTSVEAWGITAPIATPTLTANAAAGLHNGTYEGFITYYNSVTDNESSPSPTSLTVTVASKKLDWGWAASGDSQVTHVRLYIRNTATQPTFYRVASVAVGATTYLSNSSDATLITLGPITNENDPPPSGIVFCAWHNDRMFVSDGSYVYYSKYNKPEAFTTGSNIVRLETNNGDSITGLFSFGSYLVMAKKGQLWVLSMPDAQDDTSWDPILVDEVIGVTSHRSWVVSDGVARWWSMKGMIEWSGEGSPVVRGQLLIGPSIDANALNHSKLNLVVAADDVARDRVLFAVPAAGLSRNTIYIPYNYRLRAFDAHKWTAVDAASLCTVQDQDGTSWVYAGGYKGQIFRWWDVSNDGVASATTMLGTITSATATSLTASAATFDTTGAGLAQRYVVAVDPAGTRIQRRRIASNTSTVLTLDTSEDWATTPIAGWTFVVGGIEFEFDTRWMTGEVPFIRKRLQFLYMLMGISDPGVTVDVALLFNFSTTLIAPMTIAITNPEEAAEWDVGQWDVAGWTDISHAYKRVRIARKAMAWKVRYSNRQPDEDLTLHKTGMRYELLTDKSSA